MGILSFFFGKKPHHTRTSSVPSCSHSVPYVILDTETTGLNPESDKIIQLSAIKYGTDGMPIAFYDTYINPGFPIPARATKINGITDKMVSNAPTAMQIRDKFLSFVENTMIVGYNVNFDLRFLNRTFPFSCLTTCKYVDVLSIVRQCVAAPDYKLGTVASCLGFRPGSGFHDSFIDCEAVAFILHHVNEDLSYWAEDYRAFIPRPRPEIHQEDSSIVLDSLNDEGFQYWRQGDEARKLGNIQEALQLFDKARQAGYKCPAIYESYAMAYRKLKDYQSEISILEEAIRHFNGPIAESFEYRRNRANNLLKTKVKKEEELQRKKLEKEAKVEERRRKKEEAAAKPKQICGRRILQCSDEGSIIKEFDSIASAAKEVGISAKCIRDAANGRQKHAGGFCWRYIDTNSIDEY